MVLQACAEKADIPEVCAYRKLSRLSKEWCPEAFIENAAHSDEEFVKGFEEFLKAQAAFYVQFGHRLLRSDSQAGTAAAPKLYSPSTSISLAGVKLGPFKVADYFEVKLGGKDEIEDLEEGDLPIVSTSEFMNGVSAWRQPNRIYEPRAITVATDGSTCSSFVQEFKFYAFYKVAILTPLTGKGVPTDALYFVAYLLSRERWRYVYARKFGKERVRETTLLAPVKANGKPDFRKMAKLTRSSSSYSIIRSFREAYEPPLERI